MILILATIASSSLAETLRFAHSYGSNMVLQQAPEKSFIWGYMPAGGSSAVSSLSLGGVGAKEKNYNANLTSGDRWFVTLDAVEGQIEVPYTLTVKDGSGNAQTIENILFGDVWVCSGQSNMAFLLENAYNGSALVQEANDWPHIRLFTSKKDSTVRNSHSYVLVFLDFPENFCVYLSVIRRHHSQSSQWWKSHGLWRTMSRSRSRTIT